MSTLTDKNLFRFRVLSAVVESHQPDDSCPLPEQGEDVKKFAVVQTDTGKGLWIELYDSEAEAIQAQEHEINSGESRFTPYFIVDLDTGKARYTKMLVVITETGSDQFDPVELDDEDED